MCWFFYCNKNFSFNKKQLDSDCCIIILDVIINDSDYIAIDLYNANTEAEQVSILSNLLVHLEKFDTSIQTNGSFLQGIFICFLIFC